MIGLQNRNHGHWFTVDDLNYLNAGGGIRISAGLALSFSEKHSSCDMEGHLI